MKGMRNEKGKEGRNVGRKEHSLTHTQNNQNKLPYLKTESDTVF